MGTEIWDGLPDSKGGEASPWQPCFGQGHRVVLRSDAPKGKASNSVREEFQIVGNKSWDLRYYPAGGDKEVGIAMLFWGWEAELCDLCWGRAWLCLFRHSPRGRLR